MQTLNYIEYWREREAQNMFGIGGGKKKRKESVVYDENNIHFYNQKKKIYDSLQSYPF